MFKKLFGFSMSTWLGTILVFILLPITSHLFSKESLGVINYYYSVVNILFTFLLLALDQTYLRFYSELKPEQEKKNVFSMNLVLTAGLIVLCAVICLPFHRDIANAIMGKEYSLLLPALCIHLLGLLVTRYFMILYRLQSSLGKYTLISLVNSLLLKAVYILGVFFGSTEEAGICATAAAAFTAAVCVLLLDRKNLSFRLQETPKKYLRQELSYALPIIPTMVISVLNNNIPTLVIRNAVGFGAVAEYTTAVTLASMITLLHNGLNTFLEPFIFKNHENKRREISLILAFYTKAAVFACLAIVLVQDLFFLFFAEEYALCTVYLPILFASSLWFTIGDFYNIGVKIQKKTMRNIPVYIVGILCNLILCVVLVPEFGNAGAAVAAAAASFLVSIWKIALGNRSYKLMDSYTSYLLGSGLLILAFCANILLRDEPLLRHVSIAALMVMSFFLLRIWSTAMETVRVFLANRD